MKKLNKFFKGLLYILPATLYLSYWPLMHFGASESMNFELSVPLLWLVVFDVLVIIMMAKRKLLFRNFRRKWVWLLFPVWLSLSLLWSSNLIRGILTVGIVWLIYFAAYGIWELRSVFDAEFKTKFLKWFFGASLVVCAWCVIQCILDLVGVPREYSLMCSGCTYLSFGFPHPCGFAIEPQFMGNLLLAPTLVAAWLLMGSHKNKNSSSGRLFFYFFVFASTLFLTFSRGAIYAFIVGLVVMCVWMFVQANDRKKVAKRVGITGLIVVLSFLFTINIQGLMAQVSKTNDTYQTGVAKVLNQLSLGVIDIKAEDPSQTEVEPVENPVENSPEEAIYDGYVAESTDTRLRLSGAAVEVWKQQPGTIFFGVGLGGAGQALYVNGLSPAPKEIVQNQYASLLLETGLVGISLFILTIGLIVKNLWRRENKVMMLSLIIAYAVSLLFFSGLPNALHIYLLPMILMFL